MVDQVTNSLGDGRIKFSVLYSVVPEGEKH